MINKKELSDNIQKQLSRLQPDNLTNFILAGKTVRGAVVHGTELINQMRANHELGILETLVLGHAYLACGLMSSGIKGIDRITLQIDCSGPIKGLIAETDAAGNIRGYLKQVPIPLDTPLESFNLSPFFGAGFLTVSRYLKDAKHPFSGNTALQYGNLGQDLAHYYYTSEQIPTAVNLSIQFDQDGEVTGAAGLMLQAMPGADDEEMKTLEKSVCSLPSLGEFFSEQGRTDALICDNFKRYSPEILTAKQIRFNCRCTPEYLRDMLTLLPRDELYDIKENGPFPLEVRCHFCNTAYHFDKSDLHLVWSKTSSMHPEQ